MSYLDDFPHTRNYDGDLGWLITYYKELKAAYEDLLATVKNLQKLYDTIPDQIKEATDQQVKRIDALIAQVDAKLDQIDDEICAFSGQILELSYSLSVLANNYRTYVDAENSKQTAYILNYINNLSKSFPPVVCPVDGFTEDIQTVLWHMANYFSLGITVEHFDALNIPVEIFDGMNIPVQDFDRYGKFIFKFWRNFMMFSPFTGEYVPVQEVIIDLAELHMDAVTVDEFDAEEIPVEIFDNQEIDVKVFDWERGWFEEIKELIA